MGAAVEQKPLPAMGLEAALDVRLFKAWLESIPEHEPCGFARMPYRCPVATYLNWSFAKPVKHFGVTRNLISTPGVDKRHYDPAPSWVHKFTNDIDQAFPTGAAVTAQAALRLL